MGPSIMGDRPEKDLIKICDILNGLVADFLILGSHIKQAHWQIRGVNFLSLHGLLDDIHDHIQNAQDQMAERIQQLGGAAIGCAHGAVIRSKIPPLESGIDSVALQKIIESSLKDTSINIRSIIIGIDAVQDPVTVDILTEVLGTLDKDWWQLRSSL